MNNSNYNNFLKVCTDLYSKGKYYQKSLPTIISEYLDTSDKELLKQEFRKFYGDNVQEFSKISFKLSDFHAAIDDTEFTTIKAYSPRYALEQVDTATIKKLNQNNKYQKAEYKLLFDICTNISSMLHSEFDKKIFRDFDTNAYLIINDDGTHLLLSLNDTSDRIFKAIHNQIATKQIDLPFPTEKRLPKIISDFLKSVLWSSSFSLNFRYTPNTTDFYTSITDYIRWDQKTLSITQLTEYLEYICLSLYLLANWYNLHQYTIAKPSVFPLLVNSDRGTGKTTFIQDLFSALYPSNMLYQTSQFPTDKELLEIVLNVDHTRNLQGKAAILFDEFEINETPYNRQKELLTKATITARTSYSREPQTINNNRFYFFTSNTDNQLPSGERRFMVIPHFYYEGNRYKTINSIRMIALRVITQFTSIPLDRQIEEFNKKESDMQELAIRTTQCNNQLFDLAENYRDLINNYFIEYGHPNGYITPETFKTDRQFLDLSKLSKKDLCHVLKLCGYDYKRTPRTPRIMAFIPTAETKQQLFS